MAYKPENIGAHGARHIARKAASRARKSAKRAATRIARRAARLDPDDAPTRRIVRGWID